MTPTKFLTGQIIMVFAVAIGGMWFALTQLDADNFVSMFTDYAGVVARRYPWIQDWTPINEPLTTARFLTLSDAEVQRTVAFAMAESLAAGSAAIEVTGVHLKVDSREAWQPDATFFELIRERATINAMLAEVAGESVAKGKVSEKVKTQKQIIGDYLTGWMAFPFRGYGSGTCSVAAAARTARELAQAA